MTDLWTDRRGSGPPLVLLHGAGMDSRLWSGILPLLASSHTVVRYDARGLGRSPAPRAAYSDVDDLDAVLDHAGFRSAALVGLSMGAEVAIDFALARPSRVTALSLIGASVSGWTWPTDDPALAAYDEARRSPAPARLAALELSVWAAMGPAAPGWPAITAMVAHNAERRCVTEPLADPAAAAALGRLAEISVPTLVVDGDRDHPEIGRIAAHLANAVPGARRRTIEAADHYLPLRTPAALATELLDFLPR